jgi:hypothetical protein
MGLDMNFYLRKTILGTHTKDPSYLAHMVDIKKTEYPAELECFRNFADYEYDHFIIEYAVGYFRKFYPLHNFIIDCLADGCDECQYINIPVDRIDGIVDNLKISLEQSCKGNEEETKYKDDFADEDNEESMTSYARQYPAEVDLAVHFFTKIKEVMLNSKEVYELYYRASW